MANPFTESAIRNMSNEELDERLSIATGDVEAFSSAAAYPTSPFPWWTDPFPVPTRRRVLHLLGQPPTPQPVPNTYCSTASAAEHACEEAGISYNPNLSARVNAENALVQINSETDVGS